MRAVSSLSPTLLAYDAGLPELNLLLDGLANDVVAVPIDRDADALSGISEALLATGARRLQLLCHGRPGAALIGAQPITASVLMDQADVVCSWNLKSIDLFACRIGEDQEFLRLLAHHTGARIAASKGIVGHPSYGGCWDLGGAINAVVPFSRSAQVSWSHWLAPASSYIELTAYDISLFPKKSPVDNNGDSFDNTQDVRLVGISSVIGVSSIAAADLKKIDAATTGNVDTSNITAITGAASDVADVYAAKIASGNGISGLGNEYITLTSAHTLAQLIAINEATIGAVTLSSFSVAFTGSAADIAAALNGITGYTGAFTLTDSGSIAATTLSALDGLTTGTVDASSITAITGTLAAVTAAYVSSGISGLGNEAVTLSGTGAAAAAAALNRINAATTGTVNASNITAITGTVSDVAELYAAKVTSGNGISGLGNEDVALTTAHTIAQLKAINDATTGAITLGSYSVALTGSAADISAALNGIAGYTGALLLTDSDSIAATTLRALDGLTTATVDASSITAITGTLAAVSAAYASGGISGLGNKAVTLTTAHTLAQLKAINDATTGAITLGSYSVSLIGSAADITAALNGIAGYTGSFTLTDRGSIAATTLRALDGLTTGTVNASNITAITGTSSDVAAVYAAKVTTGNGISGLGNEDVKLTTDHTLGQLKAIHEATTGVIALVSYSVALTGSAADIAAALNGITGYTGAFTLTDSGSIAATTLSALDGLTSGTVDASSITAITGTLAAVTVAYTSLGISGLGKKAVILSGTGVAAADLNNIDAATTGTVDASTITLITGMASDVAELYAAKVTSGNGIYGLGNEAVTLTGVAAATGISVIRAGTSGLIDGSALIAIDGTASDVAAALAYLDTDPTSFSSTISGPGAAAADLSNIDAATTAAVNASNITTITGKASDVAAVYAAKVTSGNGIYGLGNEAVTLTGVATATAIGDIRAATNGSVNASSITAIIGSASDVAAVYADKVTSGNGIYGFGNEAVTLTGVAAATAIGDIRAATSTFIDGSALTAIDGTASDVVAALTYLDTNSISFSSTITGTGAAAADLINIDAATTGTVNASTITVITGMASDVAELYAAKVTFGNGIYGLGNEAVTLAGVAAATAIRDIRAGTSGLIDGSALTDINGTASDVAAALAYLDTDPTSFGSPISGTRANAVDLIKIDAANTATVNASSITIITGKTSDVAAVYAAKVTSGNGIYGLGNEAVTLTGVAAAPAIAEISAGTHGLIDGSALTAIDGTASDVAAAFANLDTNPTNFSSTLNAGAALATDINAIGAITGLGTFYGSALTAIVGTAANVAAALAYLDTDPTSFSATLTTGAALASDINAIAAITGLGALDGSALTAIVGTAANVAAALAYLDTDPTSFSSTLTAGAALASDINVIGASSGLGRLDGSALTAIVGTAANVAAALAYLDTDPTSFSSTLSGTRAAAADLNNIDAATTGTVNASNITVITGTASDVAAVYSAKVTSGDGIYGLGNEDVTLTTAHTLAQLKVIHDATTGSITLGSYSVALTGSAADIAAALNGITDYTGAFTLTDSGYIAATTLIALDGLTIGTVNASSITAITGSLAAVSAAYASGGISGLSNKAVTLTTAHTLAQLKAINVATTGAITLGSYSVSLIGSAADITTALNGIAGYTGSFTLTDSGSIAATTLRALDGLTTGTVNASNITAITGTSSDVAAVYDAKVITGNGISGLGNEDVKLSTYHTLAQLKVINEATTGAITLGSYSVALTGSAADIAAALNGITGYTGALTLTDSGSIASTILITLDGLTTGTVNASSITAITGTASDAAAVYAAKVTTGNGISGLGNEDLTLTTVHTLAQLKAINEATTGAITLASYSVAHTGSAADIAAALDGITGYIGAFTLTGAGASAADLNNINAATTGTFNASSITAITGTAMDIAAVYAAKVTSGNGISGLGNEAVTLSGTGAAAVDLNNIDAATTGIFNASSITAITGTTRDVAAVYAAKVITGNGISGLGNETVFLSGTGAASVHLNSIDAATAGIVNASNITSITGLLADVFTAKASIGISGLDKVAVTLTNPVFTNLVVTAAIQDIFSLATNKHNYAVSYIGDDNENSFTGFAFDDVITGKAGKDTLNGGLGADTLTGGLGSDVFRFDSLLGNLNVDTITDFKLSEGDVIQLENTGTGLFASITAIGSLAPDAFVIGASCTTAAQRIRYDSIGGNLFYDSDGNGYASSILFARVSAGLLLNSSQFVVT